MVNKVLTEVSGRHAHISKKDFETLFGKDSNLHLFKKLSQPGEFAAKEKVSLRNKNKILKNVRIVGPFREKTQIEISKTDTINLGIKVPLKLSGDLKGSSGITLVGPKGQIKLKEGLIVAKRHLHLSEKGGQRLNLKEGDKINIKIKGKRELIFGEVDIRVSPNYKDAFHIDVDEGNAAGINRKAWGFIQ